MSQIALIAVKLGVWEALLNSLAEPLAGSTR